MTNSSTHSQALSELAVRYTAEAAPVTAEPEADDSAVRGKQEIDLLIDKDVYAAAMTRANHQGRTVSAVARAVLFLAAADAQPDPAYRSQHTRPPLRAYRSPDDRTRLRFKLPRADYEVARQTIMQSGNSVSAAVEDGLRTYARTGTIRSTNDD
jgi:hypothetical protein